MKWMSICAIFFSLLLGGCGAPYDFAEESNVQNATEQQLTFREKLQKIVIPFWESQGIDGTFKGESDVNIAFRSFVQSPDKGAVVISNGQGESIIKYQELVYDFFAAGFSVYVFDHRGQGFSDRLVNWNHHICHVDMFSRLAADLKTFVETIVRPAGHTKTFLFSHSFGGAIATRYLIDNPTGVNAAVFNAPLLGVNTQKIPKSMVWLLTSGAQLFGLGSRYAPGQSDHPAGTPFDEWAGTSDVDRYTAYEEAKAIHPEIEMGGVSNRWLAQIIQHTAWLVRHAQHMTVPSLMFQAGRDMYVLPKPQNHFCEHAPHCELIRVAEARHEIYNEQDEFRLPQRQRIFQFFKSFSDKP